MRTFVAGLALTIVALGACPPVSADGPAVPAPAPAPAAPMFLHMLARPVESQEAAFRESLREAVRAPDAAGVQRNGPKLTITVSDPCPDGELFHDVSMPRPRPGRTRR